MIILFNIIQKQNRELEEYEHAQNNNKLKESMVTGNNSADVDTSVNILHDLSHK